LIPDPIEKPFVNIGQAIDDGVPVEDLPPVQFKPEPIVNAKDPSQNNPNPEETFP